MTIRMIVSLSLLWLAGLSLAQAQEASLTVTPDAKAGVYRLQYSSDTAGPVAVRITDEAGNLLHREQVSAQTELSRSYRLTQTAPGTYSVVVEGPAGTLREQVSYPLPAANQSLNLSVVRDPAAARYQVELSAAEARPVVLRIYDGDMNLLYRRETTAAEQNGQVFKLKQVATDEVIFAVSDDTQTVSRRVRIR